jgi:hypothetical protein
MGNFRFRQYNRNAFRTFPGHHFSGYHVKSKRTRNRFDQRRQNGTLPNSIAKLVIDFDFKLPDDLAEKQVILGCAASAKNQYLTTILGINIGALDTVIVNLVDPLSARGTSSRRPGPAATKESRPGLQWATVRNRQRMRHCLHDDVLARLFLLR